MIAATSNIAGALGKPAMPETQSDPVTCAAKPLRLLVISSDPFPPTRVDVAVLFGEELAGRGHQIDWILQSEAHSTRSFVTRWGGGRAWVAAANHRPSFLSRLHKHFSGIWNDTRVFRLLAGDTYQAVEVKDKFVSAVFARLAARLFRKRFIYWLSYPFPEEYLFRATDGTARYPVLYRIRGSIFSFLLYRMLLPAADHVFVQSDEMRRDVAAKGVPFSKLTAVPMGFKPQPELPGPTGDGAIPADIPSVLYLGSLSRTRRIDFLLRMFAQVVLEVPATRLYLVGKAEDAEDEAALRSQAATLGISSSVVFVGHLPQNEALKYVQAAQVCVSPLVPTPVFRVASPTKLVEYMAMGKVVVANFQPDQQLLIEETNCGYCVPYEEAAFAQATLKLLRTPQSERDLMGQSGKRYVLAHRTYQALADVVERQMLDIVSSR